MPRMNVVEISCNLPHKTYINRVKKFFNEIGERMNLIILTPIIHVKDKDGHDTFISTDNSKNGDITAILTVSRVDNIITIMLELPYPLSIFSNPGYTRVIENYGNSVFK